MAFIEYISYEDASDDLKKLYKLYGGPSATPANIVRIAGPSPKVMEAHINFYLGPIFFYQSYSFNEVGL